MSSGNRSRAKQLLMRLLITIFSLSDVFFTRGQLLVPLSVGELVRED